MKTNKKTFAILAIIFSTATVCLAVLSLLNYISLDIAMLFAGLSQIFGGLNLIIMTPQESSPILKKFIKVVGIFVILIGTVIDVAVIFKMLNLL